MVKTLLALIVVLLMTTASAVWAGENADATISFDLEKKADVEVGDQANAYVLDVGPNESLVLSIYAHGLSNLVAHTTDLMFEPDKMSYVAAGAMRISPFEFDAFMAAGLTPTPAPTAIDNIAYLAVAVLPAPAADPAPDGDGLLGWFEFTTSAEFTTETAAALTMEKCVLKGVDTVEDQVAVNPVAYVNSTDAVEPSTWARIKATF